MRVQHFERFVPSVEGAPQNSQEDERWILGFPHDYLPGWKYDTGVEYRHTRRTFGFESHQ